MKWNFAWDITAPVTALRLTEIYSDRPACATPTAGGPIDLRCVGNADPLYDTREPFANDDNRPQQTTTIDGENALAVTNYTVWVCLDPGYPYNVPLTPGLPAGGLFTAQLADRNIDFQLRYNGFNSIKWRTGDTGEFAPDRVFTLNQAPGAQFVPGNYGTLSLLTACSGGRGHRLNIQKNYSDGSTDSSTVNLYDWYNQDGDANAIPVGVNGLRRSEGTNGFRSLSKYGDSFEHGNGGTGSGAFLFVHTVPVNPCKTLSGISFSTLFPTASPMVVESRATSQGTGSFSSTGTWNPDNAKSTTGGTTPGIGSLYAGTGDNGAAATFNWTPSVTAYYNVFATWASNIDASTQAAFTVTSNGSPVTVFKNQREGGNGWQHLAQVELLAGNTYSVTLNAGLSSGGPRVYADAVRWEATGINANLLAATLGSGTCCHTPWADADGDGDVDSDDFALFQACMTITGQPITAGCDCLNPNSDATIDMTDLAAFIACSAGPEVDYIHSTVPPYWPNWPAGCPGKPAQ
jgi:hypothetical protein